MDREHPAPKQQLAERVIDVQQGRFVVDEIGVEQFAGKQLPGSDDVRCFVDIQDWNAEKQSACQNAGQNEDRKDRRLAPGGRHTQDIVYSKRQPANDTKAHRRWRFLCDLPASLRFAASSCFSTVGSGRAFGGRKNPFHHDGPSNRASGCSSSQLLL